MAKVMILVCSLLLNYCLQFDFVVFLLSIVSLSGFCLCMCLYDLVLIFMKKTWIYVMI